MSTIHATPYNPHHSPSSLTPTVPSPAYINPSQMHNAQAGPSSTHSSAAPKKKPIHSAKRKRTDTPDESGDSASQQRKNRDGPKKKKANRACFHCQKAHLTCDDSRPCQRCVKRGIAGSCTEGHRKKAKYLLDEEELEQLKRSKSSAPESSTEPPSIPTSDPFPQNDAMFNVPFDPNFPFGSEAANLEYSILSAILGNPSPPESAPTPPPPQQGYSSWPADPLQFTQSPRLGAATNAYGPSYGDPQMSIQPSETLSTTASGASSYMPYSYQQQRQSDPQDQRLQYTPPFRQPQQPSAQLHPLQPRYPHNNSRSPSNTVFIRNNSREPVDRGLLSPPPSNASPSSTTSLPPGCQDLAPTPPASCQGSQLQGINDRVTTPYDYTEGYHFLMKHLPSRFEKNDILRIVRALAIFRPSLIALQMPLSLDDEVFVEKCFQRSLLELDKLISFSGTPTVVWRRTGEICLVAPEFCMLTEWSMEELVGRKKYIYELFENQSVVEYWENFASHAFENTTQSVYSHCVLLKPSGAPVPSTFCFSIRRDLFDLPSVVIGQWLPLL